MLDTDQLVVLQRLAKGMVFDDDAFAFDAVQEIGPAGHFLGCAHTLQHYATAFFTPETSEQTTYEQWSEEGSQDSLKRASELTKQKLKDYVAPPLDVAIDQELRAFIAKRKEALPKAMT
jgi:trimethylamine--corrinoid protein Co-methyltransferase